MNIDAAYTSSTTGTGGWGCIARDSDGDVICAAAGSLSNISEALHAELVALMQAVKLAEDFGMGRVSFTTDCLPLKLAMCSSNQDLLH